MKKYLIYVVAVMLFVSCSKTDKPVVLHDTDLAKSIEGSWQFTQTSRAELFSDPQNLGFVDGILTYTVTTTQTFNPDQTYVTEIHYSYGDFTSLTETQKLSREEIVSTLDQKIVIQGTYVLSDRQLVLNGETVSVDDSQPLDFDTFSRNNPSIGSKQQSVEWQTKENNLYFFSTDTNGNEMSVCYTKL